MNASSLQLLVRVGVAAEFLGHGALALSGRQDWLRFIELFGFGSLQAQDLMLVVGCLDILLGCIVLFRPARPLLYWMVFWGFFTALLRPLAGDPLLAFVERGANWSAPLALLLLLNQQETVKRRPLAHQR